jgi:AcrR family transcriptional regulator
MATSHPPVPRPGRKRSEDSRQAILAAATGILGDTGYAGLSIEAIAQRSGTSKQTIYRWWPSKADVVMEAMATKADLQIPLPDLGSLAADLGEMLRDSFRLARVPQVGDLLRVLMAEAQLDPAFAERFRSEYLRRRRQALGVILDRAAARHELPVGVSVETAIDVVFGVLWYRLLAIPAPLDDALVDELVHLLAPDPPPAAQRRTRPEPPTTSRGRNPR